MAAERYLSRRIPDLRVGNNIDEIDKKLIPASIHPCVIQHLFQLDSYYFVDMYTQMNSCSAHKIDNCS